jgi:hypothetical protein
LRFAVHWPGNPEASPRSHGVPRRDVPGCVYVSVERETAGHAGEESLALATLRGDVPAGRAALARKRGIDPLYPAGGLVLQALDQQSPTGPQDLTIQPGFLADVSTRCLNGSLSRARHLADFETLNANHIKATRQIGAGLLGPVLTRIRFTCLEAADGQLHASAAARAASGSCQLALKAAEPALPRGTKLGHDKQFTRRHGCGDGYAAIDADGAARVRPWDRLRDCGEGDMPAAGPVPGNTVGPGCGNGSGPAEAHPSCLWHPYFAGLPAQPPDMPRLDRHDPEPFVAACLAPRGPAVGPGEKARRGLGEVPQCLLLDHLATGAQVPHVTCLRTMLQQHRLLGKRRAEPIPRHTNTLARTTDISGEVKRRSNPGREARVSTPCP